MASKLKGEKVNFKNYRGVTKLFSLLFCNFVTSIIKSVNDRSG